MWIETKQGGKERKTQRVTPHTGVWIETYRNAIRCIYFDVTPHTGVWIETGSADIKFCSLTSRPTRACGLKLVVVGVGELVGTVTPHTGRVD